MNLFSGVERRSRIVGGAQFSACRRNLRNFRRFTEVRHGEFASVFCDF